MDSNPEGKHESRSDTGVKQKYSTQNTKVSSRSVIHAWRNHSQINLLKPTGHVMHQQFNIQQLYVLSTLCLYVLYLSENKQRLVPLTA